MQLLAQEEYGLRCLVQVALHEGPEPLTIHAVAEREGLSPQYAAKLMRALRQADLVVSTRGAAGGYRLARDAGEITAWHVIEALGGSFFPEGFCETHPGQLRDCIHTPACSIRGLWKSVESAVRGVMEQVTLADLARESTRARLELIAEPASPEPARSETLSPAETVETAGRTSSS